MEIILSICIPTYNRARKLDMTIINLLNIIDQIDNHKIEIIISDNCSRDDTESVLNRHSNSIKYVIQKENLGYNENVRYLYNIALGKFVFFLADDDEIIADSFIKIYKLIERNVDDVDCFLINYLENNLSKTENNQLEGIIQFSALSNDFYKPFLFLSGFILKKSQLELNDLIVDSYFMQMDIALTILSPNSIVFKFNEFVINRVTPQNDDESGCNISSDIWKIYLGSARVIRKFEKKYISDNSFYFLEANQLYSLIVYLSSIDTSIYTILKFSLVALSQIELKYKLRIVFLPFVVLVKSIMGKYSK